jgi:predicted dehydrogenase
MSVDGRTVRIEPAVYGRDPAKVFAAADQYGIRRTATWLEELIDAPDINVIDNCLVNAEHYATCSIAWSERREPAP